jgi:protein-S-isoprenylcysteine O-methyltransferase Ste14
MSWKGERGEYWVLAQMVLLIGFAWMPVYRPEHWVEAVWLRDVSWAIAAMLGVTALVLLFKGLLDLGTNLTPLPLPKEQGELIQSGVYGLIRHPLYGGLTLAAFSWALIQLSLSHLLAAVVLLLFFNAKASQEEIWLSQKYPEYADYQQRVKKLIPWLY